MFFDLYSTEPNLFIYCLSFASAAERHEAEENILFLFTRKNVSDPARILSITVKMYRYFFYIS